MRCYRNQSPRYGRDKEMLFETVLKDAVRASADILIHITRSIPTPTLMTNHVETSEGASNVAQK